FLTAFLNVLILLPLGVYMRYFFKKTMTIPRTVLVGFLVSLFFEITQITGLYGIYTCPYRLFDVNDLLLNTTGAVFGFILAPLIWALFPSEEKVLEKSQRIREEAVIKPLQIFMGIIVDILIVSISWSILTLFARLENPIIHFLFIVVGMFILQFVIPLLTKGTTLGTKMLRFKLRKVTTDKSWAHVLG